MGSRLSQPDIRNHTLARHLHTKTIALIKEFSQCPHIQSIRSRTKPDRPRTGRAPQKMPHSSAVAPIRPGPLRGPWNSLRGLLRQQRALWDLSSTNWDRGRHPLALPKALAAQLEQALIQLDSQGPSGAWQFQPESRPRAFVPIRRRFPTLAVAIGSHGRALPAALLGDLFVASTSRPAGAQLAKAA